MIFKAAEKDKYAKDIAVIEKHCFSMPWTENQIISSDDSTVFFLAKTDEKIIGYGGMYTVLDEGYITNIGVLPDYRKMGFGKKLLNELINYSKEKKLSFLSLEVRVSNAPAIALYKSFEFEILGKRNNFYSNPKEDAFIMTRYFK